MTIRENLVSPNKYALKCPHSMAPIGICVHNTANDASAINENAYMISNTHQTSFHYAVDDKEAVLGIPLTRNAWHAGDGNTGSGNRKHIGIEICYSKSGGEKFDKAEDNAAELIAKLLKEFGWDISKVKKHQDFSGKYCPHRTLDLGWDRFLNKIKGGTMPEMYGTPNQYDLTNKESMKVAVDHLNRIQTGEYIKKDVVDQLVEQATKKGHAAGFEAGKAQAQTPTEPPETITLKSGRQIGVNGYVWKEGKLEGNYKLL